MDNVDIYGEHMHRDSYKIFPEEINTRRGSYRLDNNALTKAKISSQERHNFYISEAELQMHQARSPLWAKSQVYFHVMLMDEIHTENGSASGGELEIERTQTHMIEARSKDLIPVFEPIQTCQFQQSSDYMSPEYVMNGIFSVNLMFLASELLSVGRRTEDIFSSDNQLNLVGYAWRLWKEGHALERCIHIILYAFKSTPKIGQHVICGLMLTTAGVTKMQQPRQPRFCVDISPHMADSTSGNQEPCSANDDTTMLEAR